MRWFTLTVPDAVLRTLTREQVYATRRWLRQTARAVAEALG